MKRASYRDAVAWIAANDDAGMDLTPQQCGDLVTACLVADLWGKDSETVGQDIYRERLRQRVQP